MLLAGKDEGGHALVLINCGLFYFDAEVSQLWAI
jgi:hypothetical protein